MKFFAAFLKMQDPVKNQDFRPQHLEFLDQGVKQGTVFARGRFTDGTGGLVIYRASSLEEAQEIAASDPYVKSGARSLDLHEWDMKLSG